MPFIAQGDTGIADTIVSDVTAQIDAAPRQNLPNAGARVEAAGDKFRI